jgi:hypothetical protein
MKKQKGKAEKSRKSSIPQLTLGWELGERESEANASTTR